MKMKTMTMAAIALTLGGAAHAQGLQRVSDQATFEAALAGKQLRLGLFGVALTVGTDGTITGRATGSDVTGTWSWQDGFFCREMMWGDTEIPYDCQSVEIGGGQVRFVAERGAGDDATFNLR